MTHQVDDVTTKLGFTAWLIQCIVILVTLIVFGFLCGWVAAMIFTLAMSPLLWIVIGKPWKEKVKSDD